MEKVTVDIKKSFDNEPVYNKKYLKTKIKSHGDEVTDFYDQEITPEKSLTKIDKVSQKRKSLTKTERVSQKKKMSQGKKVSRQKKKSHNKIRKIS